jgi:hypothetical protein
MKAWPGRWPVIRGDPAGRSSGEIPLGGHPGRSRWEIIRAGITRTRYSRVAGNLAPSRSPQQPGMAECSATMPVMMVTATHGR